MLLEEYAGKNCAYDFDYDQDGKDWKCNCNEGWMQSPIQIPPKDATMKVKEYYKTDYHEIDNDDLDLIYDRGIIRIVPEKDNKDKDKTWGTLSAYDDSQIFEAYEIQIHTPAEHYFAETGKELQMEVQILHRAVYGEFRFQAIVS